MGLDAFILLLWIVQTVIAVIVAIKRGIGRYWFAASGTLVGAAIGLMPILLGHGLSGSTVGLIILSTAILVVAYAVTSRWKSLGIVLLLLVAPLTYIFLGLQEFPPELMPALLYRVEAIGEMDIMLSPILCGLAGGEVLGILDRFFDRQRKPA